MAPVAAPPETYTAEELAELSDMELKSIADGDDAEQAKLASEIMATREADFNGTGKKTGKDSKTAELEGEAGAAVGDMPKDPPADSTPEVDEIIVDGTCDLSLFDFGGKKPTGAKLTLTGGAVAIAEGQGFKKGTRIRFTGEAIVNDAGSKDHHDTNTSQVVDCKAKFGARIVDLVVESATPPAEG